MSDSTTYTGSCHCGAVAFTATGPLRDVIACHCTQCRKTSGHYWAATSVPLDRLAITRDDSLTWYRSSPSAMRGFCRVCGASLFWKPEREERMAIAAGAFDGNPSFRLTEHIFTEDAGDYYAPEGPPPATTPATGQLTAACLCGGCAFRLPAPAGEITACHCHQCRRLSGHYSASLDVDEGAVDWLTDRTLATYLTAGGGTRGFCATCGSSLWFRAADGAFSVEAGAVEAPTGGRLAAHIFVADKGAYYEIDDGLPQSPGA